MSGADIDNRVPRETGGSAGKDFVCKTLIYSARDERVLRAARNVRPAFGDDYELGSRKVIFTPSSPSYSVDRHGRGTSVLIYGTDLHRRSVAVKLENFRPYLYVSMQAIQARARSEHHCVELVEQLVNELNEQLLLASALEKHKEYMSADRAAMRRAYAGRVRRVKAGRDRVRVILDSGDDCCKPITGYEISEGLPVRGNGCGSGYTGMKAQKFLKLYVYAPALVSRVRSLLQNKNAEFGANEQAKRLSRVGARDRSKEDDGDDARKPVSQMDKAAAMSGQQTLFMKETMDPDDDDNGKRTRNINHALDELEEESVDVDEPMDDNNLDGAESEETDDSGSESDSSCTSTGDGGSSEDSDMNCDPDDMTAGQANERRRARDGSISEVVESAHADSLFERYERRLEKRFLRIACSRNPSLPMLAEGVCYDVFEADIDFVLRFQLDSGWSYEKWCEIDLDATVPWDSLPEHATTNPMANAVRRVRGDARLTRTQMEFCCDYRLMKLCEDQDVQNRIPEHVLLSLDGEMEPGPNNAFPKPETERMLQCVFVIRGSDAYREASAGDGTSVRKRIKNKFFYRSVSFVLGSVDCRTEPREFCSERHVLTFAEQGTMLEAIAEFVRIVDPHMVTGYNTDGFDLPYMLDLAKRYNVGDEFARAWSRSARRGKAGSMRARQRTFESSAAGKIVFTDIQAEGVVFIDLYKKLQRDPLVKLRQYSLNFVANHYLGDQKEDVAYSLINEYQKTADGRERLRSYCEKDALLPLEIIEVCAIIPAQIELARVSQCSLECILTRGQQVRAKTNLYGFGAREAVPLRYYTRTEAERAAERNETFHGATVVKPRPGLFVRPVITLDWASLYPSIMCQHNLSPETRVTNVHALLSDPHIQGCEDPENELSLEERWRRVEAAIWRVPRTTSTDPYEESSDEDSLIFLRHHVKLGVIPKIQIMLLSHRAQAKAEMKQAEIDGDEAKRVILNQRQLAIKMQGNSLYGVTGATSSFIYTPSVPSTVTLRGRCLLELMSFLAKHHFAEAGPEIVYGDTDSIFVWLSKIEDCKEAAEIGVRMAAFITQKMRERYDAGIPEYNRLTLEFEKVFRRLLLLAKKRYAGLKLEYHPGTGELIPKPKDGVPILSGMEARRRDTTLLISKNVTNVVGLLLDYRFSLDENLRRTRAYVWQHMVRPLLSRTINMRLLIVTKQLRMLPRQYEASAQAKAEITGGKPAALPIHVQLAQKLIGRAGGEEAQNAPRAGARLPYVVVKGAPHEKVSERGEDPVHALDNNIPLDVQYYLDKHVKPCILRLFVPIMANQKQTQQTLSKFIQMCDVAERNDTDLLSEDCEIDTGDMDTPVGIDLSYGKTLAAKLRDVQNTTSEFVFGNAKSYVDPMSADEKRRYADVEPLNCTQREAQARKAPRYKHQSLFGAHETQSGAVHQTSASQNQQRRTQVVDNSGQTSLFGFMQSGARCAHCREFCKGAREGYVCESCTRKASKAQMARSRQHVNKYISDIEDLYAERKTLADKCHDCMGCRDAPAIITCKNSDCPTLWDRKENEQSLEECSRRLRTEMAVQQNGTLRDLSENFGKSKRKRVPTVLDSQKR